MKNPEESGEMLPAMNHHQRSYAMCKVCSSGYLKSLLAEKNGEYGLVGFHYWYSEGLLLTSSPSLLGLVHVVSKSIPSTY